MRISDWSSDVCSSDLLFSGGPVNPNANDFPAWFKLLGILANKYPNLVGINIDDFEYNTTEVGSRIFPRVTLGQMIKNLREQNEDRKSVVRGKSVSVRVDMGGTGILTKKKYETH